MATKNKSPSKKPHSASTNTPKSGSKAAKKTKIASKEANDEVTLLLQLAASAPVLKLHEKKSAAKLFELLVLTEIISDFKAQTSGSAHFRNLVGLAGDTAKFAGAPASTDKANYSYVELMDSMGGTWGEAWISAQFSTLSHEIAGASPTLSLSSLHELDIMLCSPLSTNIRYPDRSLLRAGFSCKHVGSLTKESVREALGFRREMGYYNGPFAGSTAPWLALNVPADPPCPLYLVSSSTRVNEYLDHVDHLGLYTAYMRYPMS